MLFNRSAPRFLTGVYSQIEATTCMTNHNAHGSWPSIPDCCWGLGISAFLLLAVTIVFGQTIRHEFVNFDDDEYVFENHQVQQGLTSQGIAWAFNGSHADNWHPLTWISHMLDCQVYGLHAGGHHLTNVLFHAATVILLFFLLWRMTGELGPSTLVAAVFAIHPLRVESVAWVAERKDVLSGLFFVLTIGAYLGFVRHRFSLARYLGVMLLFTLGLLAKPMLVTVPFVLLLLDYWPLRRFATAAQGHAVDDTARCPARTATALQLVIEKIPLFVLAVASAGITVWAQRQAIQISEQVPFVWRLANALVTYAAYVGQFFYPARLAALYPHPGIALPIGKVVIAAVVLTAVSAAVFAWRRRRPYLLVGWLWYLGMLLPVIGLVPVGFHAMADRYTYLPQIGLSMAIVWAAKDLFGAWPYRHWVGVSISVLWVTGLIIVAWVQTTYWRDSESLWTHVLACTSRNHRAENNLGNVLFQHGRLPEAIVHYQNAIAIRPDFAEAYNNLGLALANRGETDEAIALYGTALKIQADYAGAHYNLGNALVQQGKTSEAIEHFQKAHEIQPDFAESHQNLGALLYQQRQIPQALAQWRELIRLQPDTIPILNVTAWLLATQPAAAFRNGAEAVELAERAKRLSASRDPAILDTLAAAYAEAGRFDEAIQAAQQAVALATSQQNTVLAEKIQTRLKLYQTGKPCRAAQ